MVKPAQFLVCLICTVLGSGVVLAADPAHSIVPHRIVSANLCADQLLLAFADPDQIASLSPLATDVQLSYLADAATSYPRNRGSGEDIVRLDADLVLTGPYDSRMTRALLAARNVPFEIVSPWSDFDTGEASLRQLATRLGHPERADGLIAQIEAARGRARNLVSKKGSAPTALSLHRRGYVFHAGLTGAIVADAGLGDAATKIGLQGAGFVSLEALVAAHPDYLIVSDADGGSETGAEDQGQAFLQHPALQQIWPRARRLVVPDRLNLCEGPATPALIDTLATQIHEKVMR